MTRVQNAALLTLLIQTTLAAQSVYVLTQHNDNGRTGANLNEAELNTSNVSSGQFGMLSSRAVDGQIFAQPLYVSKLRFTQGVHNVVYVATMHNSVYAFDADDPSAPILWQKNLGASVPYNFMPMSASMAMLTVGELLNINCSPSKPALTDLAHGGKYNIEPEIGITSTPAIDLNSTTIYVVPKTAEPNGSFAYRLHALDLVTGKERPGSPVLITATVGGNGDGSTNGTLVFDPKMQLQRPGLLLSNGRVYIAFGAHQDTPPYHGWILAYDARTLQQSAAFCTTPNGTEGGVWQSGNGLAADSRGDVYLMTGNGSFDKASGGPDLGDSFIKLSPDLQVVDWFTPKDYQDMINNDIDLGSAGPLLLPNTTFLVGGGKKGVFYLLNQNDMGHLEDGRSSGDHKPAQSFQASKGPDPIINNCAWDYHHIHGSPVTWNSPVDGPLVYVWAERDVLKAFRFDPASVQFPRTSRVYRSTMKDPDSSSPTKFMPGGILSVSANGSALGTGILWASLPGSGDALAALQPGILRAFDAANVSHALWCGSVGTFAKFSAPTIANGKVYLATFNNRLNIYGVGAHKDAPYRGGYKLNSSPFVFAGYLFFQGTDDKLWRVYKDGTGGSNPGGFKTKSTPFVSNGYMYFQGTDDKLWKVSVADPSHDYTNLGGYKTHSSPFVSGDYVYFRGTDDKLWRVYKDGTGGSNPGGFKTNSTPFVSNGYMYFQGTDDKLWKVSVADPSHDYTNLGGYKTHSSPFVSGDYVYFRGTDDKLWRVYKDGTGGSNPGGYKTKSTPFVSGGYMYFQGTDDTLWRVSTDGTGGSSPGCYNKTKASPFVVEHRIYFQGTDDRLIMAWADE